MPAKVRAIPDGYHTITPYLVVSGGAAAIEFYKQAFGARERMRMPGPEGRIMHAELEIGDSVVMLADESPEQGWVSPKTLGGSAGSILLYVEDVDAVVPRALAAGAFMVQPIQDQFYGDRSGTLKDPLGHYWTVATHKEDVSPEEMERRMAAMGQD